MLRKVRGIVIAALLMLACVAGHATPLAPYPVAKMTVNGTEKLIGGSWDQGSITIDFNGYLETVTYGQYSSNISLASALAAKFTNDYISFGLYAKAGANVTDPNVITFQLTNGSSFGPLNVTDPSASFSFATSGFASLTSGTPDQGTATLYFYVTNTPAIAISTASYGEGSTPSSIAQDLAQNVSSASSSVVTVTAEGPNVYLQSKQTGTYSDTYSLSFSTSLSFPSLASGTLTGTSEAATVPVYSYSVTNSSGQSGYDAVGNVKNVTDSVMGTWSYSYDDLNRLVAGQASISGDYAGQYTCWSYDDFGNRTHQSISNQPFVTTGSSCKAASGASLLDTAVGYGANNQISSVTSPALTVAYDGAGNVTNDGYNSYLYDAEGRICALNGPQGMVGYQYDAAGNRVGRGTITSMNSCDITQNGYQPASDYVLDLSGGQMTEVSVGGVTPAWQHTNVTANGMLIATYDTTGSRLHFYVNDALGSRRVQTDPAGFPEQTCQNLPFGDQLYCTGSLTSPTEHHFTGKERDSESGNDYFGARYYGSSMGRFMSPDWSDENDPVPYADFSNPQSLNLYSYAYNNPLRSADADGHVTCDPDTWDDSTNTLTAGACHYDLGDFMNSVGQIAQQTTSALSNAAQTVSNFVATNQTLCQVAMTAGGMAGGALAGGETGGAAGALIGGTGGTFVAPGVGTIGGGAGGAAVGATIGSIGGGIAGGIAGYAASNSVCSSGGGSGGSGGSGGGAGKQGKFWKSLKNFRGNIKTNGLSGSAKRFFQFDYTHGDVEVYNGRGQHLGSADPETGVMTKPAVPGRTLQL